MKILQEHQIIEQNLNDLRNFKLKGNLEDVMPLIYMDHADRKFQTHITNTSNYFLFGLKSNNPKSTIKKMIEPLIQNGNIKQAILNASKTENYDFIETFNIGFKREIPSLKTKDIFVLYNNLRFGITQPFVDHQKKHPEESIDEWVEKCIKVNPDLSPLRSMKKISNNPYVIVLAFTGGFKNKNRFKWPYRNGTDVLYEVDNTSINLPEVTEEDFQKLLQYQKNAV